MTDERAKRKLSAVLSADVKGYSRLMGQDEAGTVDRLKGYRTLMADLIQQYRGRVVDSPGDNILAEFASVVDATECSVKIQEELKNRNAELPRDRRMEFRIGINLGDVIEDEDSIYGDGVNIAARLESLAEGGGICVSGSVFDQIEGKIPLSYDDLGEQSFKNIKSPVRVYRISAELEESLKVGEEIKLPDEPSIAVLPFENMSGDPEQEYFSDGLTEEIITGLSKLPHFFVIARNSTFTYKGKAVRVQQVSREMGAKYVLEGSVRSAGGRVRITAQLVDGTTGQHLWADRYDRELKDIFAIQDEITMNIMMALQVKLTGGDQARLQSKYTSNLEAYVKYLQANEYFNKFSKEGNILARQQFQEAIALDSGFAPAYAGLAGVYLQDAWIGWSENPEQTGALAMQYAQKCIALDKSLPLAHAVLGLIHLVLRQWDKAIEESEIAVSLSPNSADSVVILAITYKTVGRIEEALSLLKKATRLNPMTPNWYLHELGTCYRLMGRYEEAIAVLKKVLNRSPDYLLSRLNLIATYVMSGKEESARIEAVELLKQSPNFSVPRILKNFPYKDQKILDDLKECWIKAGLK